MAKKADLVKNIHEGLMAGVTLEEVDLPKQDKDPEEYRKFCRYANMMYTDPFFDLIKKQILLAQISRTAIDSTSYEEVQYGRAVIHGLALFEEIFKKYSLLFESQFQTESKAFDPGKGFESVANN